MRLLGAPLDPDQGQAQQWLADELAKPEYQSAKPTVVDRVGQAIGEFFQHLLDGAGGTPPALGIVIVLAIAAAVVLLLFLVHGAPRADRRSLGVGALFGEDERRSAARIRADADAAARAGDWALAVAERYRAIARALDERGAVSTLPGTTAHEFAARAADAFPGDRDGLATAADAFDAVRYLARPGDAEQYQGLVALDRRLEGARPAGLAGTRS